MAYLSGLADIFPARRACSARPRISRGVRARDADQRPWLRHAAWPRDYYRSRRARRLRGSTARRRPTTIRSCASPATACTRFRSGPVHAGIIEPGHFRFSIVGEKVLKLEERLGYVHKGIERRSPSTKLARRATGSRRACRAIRPSRISWAYCQALEGIARCDGARRARLWLRALALECERIANHLGDLGALGNDAGFAFGLAQFSRFKEHLAARARRRRSASAISSISSCRAASRATRATTSSRDSLTARAMLGAEAATLRTIYDEHAGVRDRFAGAGTVTPDLAARLGLIGLAGRASGQALDLRVDLPCASVRGARSVRRAARDDGDVAARVAVRFDELTESLRLVREIVEQLPPGELWRRRCRRPTEGARGIGLIEGWRGPVLVALDRGPGRLHRRCHPHDPSWQNWPVLEHAIIGNIVPDFPLINKSFNLSYSGHDL